jgi:hypothetical protein
MECAVAAAAPAFLILTVRIGAEQHAAGLQRRAQFSENPGQLSGDDFEG